MAYKAHGVVTVKRRGGKPRRVPASQWYVDDNMNYLKKQGYELVTSTPPPVEAKAKGRKKMAEHPDENETAE